MNAEDVIKIILTAAAAAGFTVAITWLKASRDDRRAQADEYNKVLLEAADLASKYWLISSDDPELQQLEARLIGYQQRLNLLQQIVFEPFSDFDRNNLKSDIVDFLDACTGGDFRVGGRALDTARAIEAQAIAAQIAARVRKASLSSATLLRHLARLKQRRSW